MSTPSLSVILPTYNEGKRALDAAAQNISALEKSGIDYELIIVDDGSTDLSAQELDQWAVDFPKVKIIKNIVNLNQGVSILRGFGASSKEFVFHNGVDLPVSPENMINSLSLLESCDVLVLQREKYSGASLWRKFVSFCNQSLRQILFPGHYSGIHDMNFTQFYRRKIVSQIMPIARSPGFTTPELIMRARISGFKISTCFVPMQARKESKGAFGRPHDILWSMYDMIRFRIYLFRKPSTKVLQTHYH